MKFYRYWARGEAAVAHANFPWKVRGYGGSNDGMEIAQRRAQEAAERIAAALEHGRSLGTYGYADRPLREEIVEELRDADGQTTAIITRNAYGALVLNTDRVMFVDVDYFPVFHEFAGGGPTLGESLREAWDWLRGKPSTVKLARDERILSRINEVVRSRRGMGARVYCTAGGFRLLISSATFDPMTVETNELLSAFGSDLLYTRLCKSQECFRARLSAKFWRCGANRPPSRFPWADAGEEAEYRRWEQEYHGRANQYATCELAQTLGDETVHSDVAPILEMHDRLTIRAGAPLA